MKPEHPEMQSLSAQIAELDRQIAREAGQITSGRNNTLLADYRAARRRPSARFRRGFSAQGRRAQPPRPKHSVQHLAARG